jgi:hypothetical protein
MKHSFTYKLLFAVHDHCEFAEVSVVATDQGRVDFAEAPPIVSIDDKWAIAHAQNGISAAAKWFGIDSRRLRLNALRVTYSDSTPDNVAVAAFIAVGVLAGRIDDTNSYIDNFIHDDRIRFPRTETQFAEWLPCDNAGPDTMMR